MQTADSMPAVARIQCRIFEDLWYSDGTVIIHAETTLFRVYAGLLSQHSALLKDMIEKIPSSTQYKGLPLLQLQDKAADLTHFLRAIFQIKLHNMSECISIPALASVLRIATKYKVPDLQAHVHNVLRTWYPSKYDLYVSAPDRTINLQPQPATGRHMYMVNVIRETNALEFLPTALLACCSLRAKDIFDGVDYNGEHVELSEIDKRAVSVGRQRLLQMAREVTYETLFGEVPVHVGVYSRSSGNYFSCAKTARLALRKLIEEEWFNPFLKPQKELCESCTSEINEALKQHAASRFGELPKTFDIQWTWQELTNAMVNGIALPVGASGEGRSAQIASEGTERDDGREGVTDTEA